jgi:3-oxoacyl-[acyl-carrier protein] reductase
VHELGAAAAKKRGISFEQWKKEAEEASPLGRFGDPLEFGALVAFLASERSEFMNGTTIAIDGGALKTTT